MDAPLQSQTLHALAFAVMTGSTCGDACWHAREEICRCSCGGANHGILNRGDTRPRRTCKIDGQFYELAGIIAGRADGECWNDVFKRTDAARHELTRERFPNIDPFAYGAYRQESTFPVVDRKISPTQAKWPEVAAVHDAMRLIWARPAGSVYYIARPSPLTPEQRRTCDYWQPVTVSR